MLFSFKNLSVKLKLIILSCLSFIWVAAIISVGVSSFSALREANEFKDEIVRVMTLVEETRLLEKTYQRTHLDTDNTQLQESVQELYGEIKHLEGVADVVGLKNALGEYEQAWAQYVTSYQQRIKAGDAVAEPLAGAMKEVDNVIDIINMIQSEKQMEGDDLSVDEREVLGQAREAKILLLTYQAIQKDFLLTGDQKYMDEFKSMQGTQQEMLFAALGQFADILEIEELNVASLALTEGVQLVAERSGAVQAAFKAENEAIDALDSAGDKILSAANKDVQKIDEMAATAGRSMVIAVVLIVVVGALVFFTLATVLTVSITRPISKALGFAKTISTGDLSQRLHLSSRDEIGQMAAALDSMADGLQTKAQLAEAIAAGDLSGTAQMASDQDVLGCALGTMLAAVKEMAGNVNMLAQAAIDGDFATRADAEKFQGDFRRIVEGVNGTLDTVVQKVFWFEAILDSVPLPVSVTDENGLWTFVNKALEEMTGFSRAEAMGRSCGDWNNPLCGTDGCCLKELERGNHVVQLNQDGKDYQVNISHLQNAAGDRIGFIEVLNDVTRNVQIENFSRQEVKRLQENLQRIASGSLELDMNISSASEYVQQEYENFKGIDTNLAVVKESIERLIEDANKLAEAAVEGRLDERADAAAHKGDYQSIIRGINNTLDAVVRPLNEASDVLAAAAECDLSKQVTGDYKGKLAELKNNVNLTMSNLDEALGQVNMVVQSVSQGASQINDAAQSLSKGATDQASSLEEISSSMAEIASQTKTNADNATQANGLASQVRSAAETGSGQMSQMVEAMNAINESSGQIAKIIKVIDDIAFQTNLLALNAAVEAARAGRHGKGFAVVADEVRNLAGRSAKAAKETADLIDSSSGKVENGLKVAGQTAESFQEIVDGIVKTTDIVGEIAAASSEQAQGVSQVNVGLNQVDQVTQQNTASAEQTSSAVQELTRMTYDLQKQLARFVLTSVGIPQLTNGSAQAVEATVGKNNEIASASGQGWAESAVAAEEDIIRLDEDYEQS